MECIEAVGSLTISALIAPTPPPETDDLFLDPNACPEKGTASTELLLSVIYSKYVHIAETISHI
jgi:hypothetical protein